MDSTDFTSQRSILERLRFLRSMHFFKQYKGLANEEILIQIKQRKIWERLIRNLRDAEDSATADQAVLRCDPTRVCAFDTEIVDDTGLGYITMLQALAHVSQGLFTPQNIEERWPKSRGPVEITFTFQRESYQYVHEDSYHDYIQLSVVPFVNKLVADTGYLFYMSYDFRLEYFIMLNQQEYDKLTQERGWRLGSSPH